MLMWEEQGDQMNFFWVNKSRFELGLILHKPYKDEHDGFQYGWGACLTLGFFGIMWQQNVYET